MQGQAARYAGFWVRVAAAFIDGILFWLAMIPLTIAVYGRPYSNVVEIPFLWPHDFLILYVFPAVTVILFWIYKAATPGKMAVGVKIIDAQTGDRASRSQMTGRYFAYLLLLPSLGLSIFWVAFDRRKQGWHDKLAGTVVVYSR